MCRIRRRPHCVQSGYGTLDVPLTKVSVPKYVFLVLFARGWSLTVASYNMTNISVPKYILLGSGQTLGALDRAPTTPCGKTCTNCYPKCWSLLSLWFDRVKRSRVGRYIRRSSFLGRVRMYHGAFVNIFPKPKQNNQNQNQRFEIDLASMTDGAGAV